MADACINGGKAVAGNDRIVEERRGRSVQGKIWQTALYVRLSREDEDKGESNSIVNQKKLLLQYMEQQEDLELQEIYVDDGWSGTTFERPSFQRMIREIQRGRIDCVLVKDLSRFGRNYIDAGEYLEKMFPRMDVRFIAVNDNIDSVKDPQSMNTILVPFRNLINDEYCRDISNKVRSSLDVKRKQGQHIGSFACYGYEKDPEDRNHLVVDPEAAQVVKDIFSWYLSGMSIMGITRELNQLGLPNPSTYKKEKGHRYRNRQSGENDGRWTDSSVRRILSNRMYTGDLVQGVQKTKSYKVQISKRQPEEKWIIVENTHEAIVSRENYEMVREIMGRNGKPPGKEKKVYLFSGYLKCGDCGRGMIRKTIRQPYGEYTYYVCSTYTKRDKNACTKHTVKSEWLEEKVLAAIRSQMEVALDMERAKNSMGAGERKREEDGIRKKAGEEAEKIKKAETMMLELYPDWKAGILTREEYLKLKERFLREKEEAEKRRERLLEKLEEKEKGKEESNLFIQQFLKFKNIKKLTREVVVSLIHMIYIYEDKKIRIQFKYQDPYGEG